MITRLAAVAAVAVLLVGGLTPIATAEPPGPPAPIVPPPVQPAPTSAI